VKRSKDRKSSGERTHDRPPATPPSPTDENAGGLITRIENALAILRAYGSGQPGSVRRHVDLAVTTLEAARAGVADLERTLETTTDADLDAVRALQDARDEITGLRKERERHQRRIAELEARLEADEVLQDEQTEKLRELEKKSRTLDDVLATDPNAFDAYMQKQLGVDPPSRRPASRDKKGGKR
jgi:Asp-tRNA(Asn)/Glu-tRNA(Gln) amidotransferase A subunit family amidase